MEEILSWLLLDTSVDQRRGDKLCDGKKPANSNTKAGLLQEQIIHNPAQI